MRNSLESHEASPLVKQELKIQAAWSIVSRVFPQAQLQDYLYHWCIVNSRSFYWEIAGEKLPQDHDDRIVLVPFIDYFNHNDHGVGITPFGINAYPSEA